MARKEGQLTKQQQMGTQGIGSTVSASILSEDDIKLMLSFLWHWDIARDDQNKPKLVRASKSSKPAIAIGESNYSRLRYKLEHINSPKSI